MGVSLLSTATPAVISSFHREASGSRSFVNHWEHQNAEGNPQVGDAHDKL